MHKNGEVGGGDEGDVKFRGQKCSGLRYIQDIRHTYEAARTLTLYQPLR
jgi:hypothetical protein